MRLSLNVLQHLGLSLYSNVPAVLSEAVANAWDADASRVDITLDPSEGRIVIQDDGSGMTRADVNNRFLFVGYVRRADQPGETPLKRRKPMGRKGIGKLSLFSIANEILVETARNEERNALRMTLSGIQDAIGSQLPSASGEYEPDEWPTDGIDFGQGTRITLGGLRKRQTVSTAEGLRRRLARRFSIIGPSHDFEVAVNGTVITPADRAYSRQIQYAWAYEGTPVENMFESLEESEARSGRVPVPGGPDLEVRGWLGTVQETKQLRDESGENLNRIAIFMRGKMAQEDILGDLGETGVYAGYLIGELTVDGLDTDDQEDSATSSRQRILEDDPRYIALKAFITKELSRIEVRWQSLRGSRGLKQAERIPQIKTWVDSLPSDDARHARRWIARVYRIRLDDENERREILKQSIIAFEFHRWTSNIDRLQSIEDNNLEAAIATFRELDVLESNLYGQIVKNRIEVIRTLKDKVDENQKERAIQQYIFDHLWLLDPNWERVEGSELMESRVGTMFAEIDDILTEEEKSGRLDIKYRQVAGKHVIIELKRPKRKVSVYDLGKQIQKYRSGLKKILEDSNRSNEPIEFICLLGSAPIESNSPDGLQVVENTLQAQNARYLNYDQLLNNAYGSYRDYLKKSRDIDRLSTILEALGGLEPGDI